MESNQSIFSALPIELSARIMSEAGNPYASLVSKEFNAYFQETNKCVLSKLLKYLPEELSSQSNLQITKKIEKKFSKKHHSNTALLNLIYKKLLKAANMTFVPLQRDYSDGIISVAWKVFRIEDNLMKIWDGVLAAKFQVTDLNMKNANEVKDWLGQHKEKVNKVRDLCLIIMPLRLRGDKEVDMIATKLTAIPQEIGEFSSLLSLICSKNQLQTLPAQIGMLKQLRILDASQNLISTISEPIWHLPLLTRLSLEHNSLTRVPTSIRLLSKLEILRLDHNKLSTLPSEIGELSSLKVLSLNNNRLKSIPMEIAKLTSLNILYLQDNILTTLPQKLSELTRLNKFNVDNNPFYSLPPELGKIMKKKVRLTMIRGSASKIS